MKDLIALGSEHSSLEKEVSQPRSDRILTSAPIPMPEENCFIRSDQYSFVLQGVPAVRCKTESKHRSQRRRLESHQGVDGHEISHATGQHGQPLNYESGAKATGLNFLMGYEVAQQDSVPAWNQGDFFGQKFGSRHSGTAGED